MTKRRALGVLTVLGVALCFAVFVGCASDPAPMEINGVTALDVYAVYDGTPRYIEIDNVLETDEIYYKREGEAEWRGERIACILPGEYKIYYKVVRAGCDDYVSHATVRINRGVLTGISANDAVYIYDGKPHGINIIGLRDSDSVTYSTDGIEFIAECELTEPGEYTVYYRVSDRYGDYYDECRVTVLPDISGRYFSAKGGLIVLDNLTAKVNGVECELEYGADGRGRIADKSFAVTGKVLSLEGIEYAMLGTDEYVYRVVTNTETAYIAAREKVRIAAIFDSENNVAEIKADNDTVLIEHGVNYCESIAGKEPKRRYDGSDVESEISASGGITTVEICLALRGTRTVEAERITLIYDGTAHAAGSNAIGTVMYLCDGEYVNTPPEFTEPGEYRVDIAVTTDGYLPAFSTVEMRILPNIDGVYCNAESVIEISGFTARRNGETAEYEFGDGMWRIDGEAIETTGTGMTVNGTPYEKQAEGTVLVITINGARKVIVNAMSITLRVYADRIEISGDITYTQPTEGEATVSFNGSPAIASISDGAAVYIFGLTDLTMPVAFIDIMST